MAMPFSESGSRGPAEVYSHVAVIDRNREGGQRILGRFLRRLSGSEVETAAVQRTLDLASFDEQLPHLQLRLGVGALALDGVELLLRRPDQKDAPVGDGERPHLTDAEVVAAADEARRG